VLDNGLAWVYKEDIIEMPHGVPTPGAATRPESAAWQLNYSIADRRPQNGRRFFGYIVAVVNDAPDGITFGTCSQCGVACCSECAAGNGLCPDCQSKEG